MVPVTDFFLSSHNCYNSYIQIKKMLLPWVGSAINRATLSRIIKQECELILLVSILIKFFRLPFRDGSTHLTITSSLTLDINVLGN